MTQNQKNILSKCIIIEEKVVGNGKIESQRNGRLNFSRAFGTFKLLKTRTSLLGSDQLNVLNLSGVNTGEYDLSLLNVIQSENIKINSWVAYDSPKNDFINNPYLLDLLKNSKIQIKHVDFCRDYIVEEMPAADLVLVCDVIEHIDYSHVLGMLNKIKKNAPRGCFVVVTCPNPGWIVDRIKCLFGVFDWFDNDVKSQLSTQHFGHINIFPANRLRKITEGIGFEVIDIKTINHWRYEWYDNIFKYAVQIAIDLLCKIWGNLGFTIVAILRVK